MPVLCFSSSPQTLIWIAVLLASFTPNLHHRHTDRLPELTATDFAGVVHGAGKQTRAAVSHDPKAGALEKIVKASQLEIIELQHSNSLQQFQGS
ncbi:hypothetical protein ACJW31_05G137400 [Castanea mollissima]